MEEAAQLAESTSVLLNVSEFSSIEDATGALTSTMQAFGYVAEDSMHVVDVLNEVGNNFAISSDGIATALQDSASALMAANNSYEEAVALIAAANRVVQDPNSVGAALRTISLRLRGTSVKELEEAGEETTGAITSKSKLRGKIKSLSGIDILTDTGAYKSTYEILLEISRVWKKMSDIDQAALLEILAGKNRANTAMAILSNTTDLEEAYVQALKAEGSAYAENEKYLDSIQGKIDQFNNAAQTMWSNALDDEVVKKFVSLGTIIIQTIDKIGAIKTALAALSVGAMIKNKTGPVGLLATIIELAVETSDKIRRVGAYLTTLASSTNPVAKAISDVVAAQTALQASNLAAQYNEGALTQAQLARKATTLSLTQSVTTLNVAQMSQALQTANVSREQRLAAIQALGLNTNTKALTATEIANALATAGVDKANIAATLSALGLSTANKGLAASFKALMVAVKPLLIIGAIVAGVALLAKGIDAAITTTEELSEELSTLKTELIEIQSELKTVNQELQTTQDRINELLAKDKLSFTEEEELKQLQKTNDELQRQADLLALKEKQKKHDTADKFVEKMKSDVEDDDEHTWFTDEDNWWDKGKVYGSETEYLNHQLALYEDYQKQKAEIEQDIIDAGGEDTKEGKKLTKEKEKIDKNIKEIQDYINGKTDEWAQDANGLDYGINPETDKWLDYIADIEDRWAIISGGDNAKSNAIKRIFNQEEFADASEEIDGLIKQLESGADSSSIEKQIEGVISGNEDLKNKLFELGITTDEAARSFTRLGEAATGAIEEESKLTDSISKIAALEDAFNSLGSAMKEFKEEGTASADTLESLNETFGVLDGFEDLYKVLATGEGNVEEAITKVANAYIAQAGVLSDVTDDELQIMVARLESLGVINAQEVLMHRQTLQQELNEKLQGYNIDLSTYATVEQAKEAIAKMATGNVCSAVVEMENELATQYGINLSDFASTEEAKVKAAKKAALEIAKANKEAAVSAIRSDATLTERQVAEKWAAAEDDYRRTVNSINAIDTNIKSVVASVTDTLNNYYSQPFKFNFSGKQIGIGRDYDEEVDTKEDKAEDKAKDEFDKLRKKYESKISHLENQQTYLENEISKLEAQDEQVGKAVYEEQIRLEEEKIDLYEQERAALLEKMKDIPKESDLWYDYADAIWETEHAIQESSLAVLDFQQKIADLYIDVFGKIEDAYDAQQSLYDKQSDYIRNNIEYAELMDLDIPASAYKELMGVQENKYVSALDKIASLENALNLGVNDEGVEFSDDELSDMVLRLQDAKLEAQEARNEMAKINDELKELYVTAFDKVGEAYDALGSLYDDRASYVEGDMELQKLRGKPISTDSYNYLIENETSSLAANIAKLDGQRQKLFDAMENGVQKGSEEWIEMEAEIRATEKAIQDNYIALEQYNEELKSLYSEAFNKVRDSFSDVTDVYDDQQAFIESYIDYLETLGVKVPADMYERLGEVELEKQQANIQKLADMKEALAKMESEGYTPEDEEWVQAKSDIRDVEKAIWDSEVAMAEFNKAIRDMETEKFEEFIKRIGDMVNELDRVYDLLSKEDVATEDGAWTEEGITSLGLLYHKMEISKKQIADYQEAIEKLNDEYKSGAISEQEYNDRLVELKNSQWDSIDAYEEAKDAIIDVNEARIDMIEKGIDKEIEAYQELIDIKKKELDAERDLYEFRKNINNQTKDIAALERRIAAMSGSTDAATIAERTKLEAQLREAREGLDDTYYTHAMDSQSAALDDENEAYVKSKEDYVEMLREALEDVEAIVTNTMSQVLINADTVLGTLNGVSGEYGITLSESLTSPWISAAQKAEEFKNSALMQEYEFAIQNGIFTGEITADFSDMFDNTTLMATTFQTDVYTVMEAIKLHVDTSTSDMTSALQIPFSEAKKYATETFSPQTMDALQSVANKAAELVYQEETNIKQPWEKGDEAANTFKKDAEDALQAVADKAAEYSPTTANALKKPAEEGSSAWNLFGTNVGNIFTNLITKANEAATKIGGKMDDIIADAQAAANAIANTGVPPTTGGGGGGKKDTGGKDNNADILSKHRVTATLTLSGKTLTASAENYNESTARQQAETKIASEFRKYYSKKGKDDIAIEKLWKNNFVKQVQYTTASGIGWYAKGTTGTTKDQWAMTDEIGDELVLIPGKNGNLQYMRKGTAVIPADISANLMEWGKLSPNMDMSGAVQGVNLMTNVISKPELNLSFDALVKAEHITEETLPAVKKLVTEELDKFTRNLNYSLRRVGAK